MKILVVDDNEDVADLYRTALKNDEYEWVVMTNGFEALDYLRENNDVRAAVIDLAMPTLDGLAVAQEIRRNENLQPKEEPVRIAFLTAYDETKPTKRVREKEDVEKYFIKPKTPAQLAAEVKEWLK